MSKRNKPVRFRTVDSGAPSMAELHSREIDWELLSREVRKRKSLQPPPKKGKL